jgi:hypothetical protein
MSNKILVLGSTGKTGRRVAERLPKSTNPHALRFKKWAAFFQLGRVRQLAEVLKGSKVCTSHSNQI